MNGLMKRWVVGAVSGLGLGLPAMADLELPPIFGNHMVVQRDQPIAVWGTADADSAVTIRIGATEETVRSDSDGRWSARMPAMEAGGPHRVEIASGDDAVTLQNVLVGDVWVCSGQSNMYWRLEQTDRGEAFVDRADELKEVRLFQMQKVWSRSPEDRVQSIGWRMSSGETAGRFSAVGYHFGRILHEQTGVPIGLIHSSWGGTPAEAWTPMETFSAAPEFYADRLKSLEEYDLDDETAARLIAEAQEKHADFIEFAWREDIGEASGWATQDFDDKAWKEVELPGYVDGELGSFNGIVWLRRSFELDDASGASQLLLGRIDDYDTVYINGQRVGKTDVDQGDGRQIVRLYDIAEGVLQEGRNVIAIALMDVRSSGGVTPDGKPFELRTPSETVSLSGMWKYQVGFNDRDYGSFPLPGNYAVPTGRAFRRPSALYNAMIHPITRVGVKGAIWYQGESNAGRGDEYRRMFPEMIMAWREAWARARDEPGYALPFYFVQLPNYKAAQEQPGESSWAELREAQRLTELGLPHTGMAITIDLGDPSDIHPTNKLPVAERLARLALADVYGIRDGEITGPHPSGMRVDGARVRISFEDAEALRAMGGPLKGFAVAGSDGVFRWADAQIAGSDVVVSCPAVASPVRVRYGWADNPGCNLYNEDGLPATPFELSVDD